MEVSCQPHIPATSSWRKNAQHPPDLRLGRLHNQSRCCKDNKISASVSHSIRISHQDTVPIFRLRGAEAPIQSSSVRKNCRRSWLHCRCWFFASYEWFSYWQSWRGLSSEMWCHLVCRRTSNISEEYVGSSSGPASCWFLASLIRHPWIWGWHVPLRSLLMFSTIDNTLSQNSAALLKFKRYMLLPSSMLESVYMHM